MLKADFHIHTSYSPCSNMKPIEVVSRSISEGLDVIGVVDHHSIKGGLAVKQLAKNKLLVIPGEEIKTEYGDIIVFLSDGKFNRNLIDICERAKDQNCFVFVPHPFDYFRNSLGHKMNEITKYIDIIEVFNARSYLNVFNKKAKEYADKFKLPKVGGSDAHTKNEIGCVVNYLDCGKNLDSIFEYVKKNKVVINGNGSSPLVNIKSSFFKLNKWLRT